MKWFSCLATRIPSPKISARNVTSTSTSASSHPELSRLAKASAVRSLRFKRTTPGRAFRLLVFGIPDPSPLVDHSHPLGQLPSSRLRRTVPHYECSLFQAHAFPHAVLSRFKDPQFHKQLKGKGVSSELDAALDSQAPPSEPNNLEGVATKSIGDHRRAMHGLPMSLMITMSKKSVSKSAFLRNRIKRKIKEALSLVVIRGAIPGADAGGSPKIVLNTSEGISRESTEAARVLQGWTYIIRPSLEVYRCPWPSLLEHIGKALVQMRSQADVLHNRWNAGNYERRPKNMNNRPKRPQDPPRLPNGQESKARVLSSDRRGPDIHKQQLGDDHPSRMKPRRSPSDHEGHDRQVTTRGKTYGTFKPSILPTRSRQSSFVHSDALPELVKSSPEGAVPGGKPVGKLFRLPIVALDLQKRHRRAGSQGGAGSNDNR